VDFDINFLFYVLVFYSYRWRLERLSAHDHYLISTLQNCPEILLSGVTKSACLPHALKID